ncbi:MAG: hypothetical protein K0R39_1420 [Symbiobacteriaceae bacterium]|jgi:anaerobic dimethyl sulfoxide reductase subunit C (anchor subunit)|nr:hypothetical protein [Symbiobacteriaceae bacterium]
MLHAEWPLALFTLLGQAAAGIYLAVVLVREILARRSDAGQAIKATVLPSLVAGGLMIAAAIVSFLHLGSPLGAYRVLLQVGSSWLSREIAATMLFGLLWLGSVVVERRGGAGLLLGRLTALAGVVLVLCMSMIYQSSVIPAWTSAYTMVSFVATTLVLGGLGMLALRPGVEGVLPVAGWMTLAGLVLQLGGLPLYLGQLAQGSAAGRASLTLLMGAWQPQMWSFLVLGSLTAVAAAVVWQRRVQSLRVVYALLLVGLVGEAMARVIFYAIGVPVAVG